MSPLLQVLRPAGDESGRNAWDGERRDFENLDVSAACLIVGFVFVAVVIVSGALFVRRWQERGPDEASVSAAVDRFRSSSTTAGGAGTDRAGARRVHVPR